jgi:hypothetical protein
MTSRLHLHTTLGGETQVGCSGDSGVVIDGSP